MKKIKLLLLTLTTMFLLTGCFKRDNMDDISIYATTYPIEYLVNYIYGYNSNINSIYPNGVDTHEYKLTDKKIKEYSQTDMFIYNGLTSEKTIAADFLNKNHRLKIIDVSKGLSIQRDEEELWLSPANYLMLAQNIKNSLNEYTSSTILKQEIIDNYNDLKLIISKYDAELSLIADNAANKTIIAGNDVFKFLEKYGFKVLSVEENDLFVANELTEAKNNISSKLNSYVFILSTDEENENTTALKEAGAEIVKIHSMINLTDEEENENLDYQTMMEELIEAIKTEVYN